MKPPRLKARKRPGPWVPIRPTRKPCQVVYVDALCTDIPTSAAHSNAVVMGTTPRQMIKRREMAD